MTPSPKEPCTQGASAASKRLGWLLGCLMCCSLPTVHAADSSVPPLIDLSAEAKKQSDKSTPAVSQPVSKSSDSATQSNREAPSDSASKSPSESDSADKQPTRSDSRPAKPVAWSYFGDTGPQAWGNLSKAYDTCQAGQNQSPINFKSDALVGTTSLEGFDVYYRKTILKMLNDGHVLKVEVPLGSYIMLNQQRYELIDYVFHTPSEHQVDGFSYPMELQLKHRNGDGQYVMISVLFQEGEAHEAIGAFLDRLPQQLNKLDIHDKVLVHPAKAFFPTDKRFFKYNGSMTQPPCDEGVYWMVFKEPVEASSVQLSRMAEYLGTNARPVQKWHARTPLKSWPDARRQRDSFYLY